MYKPKREFGEKEGKGTRPKFWVLFLRKEENKGKETAETMEGPREYIRTIFPSFQKVRLKMF